MNALTRRRPSSSLTPLFRFATHQILPMTCSEAAFILSMAAAALLLQQSEDGQLLRGLDVYAVDGNGQIRVGIVLASSGLHDEELRLLGCAAQPAGLGVFVDSRCIHLQDLLRPGFGPHATRPHRDIVSVGRVVHAIDLFE